MLHMFVREQADVMLLNAATPGLNSPTGKEPLRVAATRLFALRCYVERKGAMVWTSTVP